MKLIHFVAVSLVGIIATGNAFGDSGKVCGSAIRKRGSPVPDASGVCFTHTTQYGDTCAKIAEQYSVSVPDIENWNTGSWGWTDCPNIMPGDFICVSPGALPMPKALPDAQCGPQTPGAIRPANYADLASVSPCGPGLCCARWLKCGNSSESCSSENGCLSGCGAFALQRVAKVLKAAGEAKKEVSKEAASSTSENVNTDTPETKAESKADTTAATTTKQVEPHGATTAENAKVTWKVTLYEGDTCDGGNYYYLKGHNDYSSNDMPCLQLNQGYISTDMMDESKPSCRWWTDNGHKWEKCTKSPLNYPKSWFLERGFCTVFVDDHCQEPGGRLDQRGGCHHPGEEHFSPTLIRSMQCFSYGDSSVHNWQGRDPS